MAKDTSDAPGETPGNPASNGHAPTADHIFTISGKEVRLKQHIPAKEGRYLPKLTKAMMESGDLFDQVPLGVMMIESWDFPGDPAVAASYEDFDLWELTAMMNAVGNYVNAKANGAASPKK